MPESDFYLALYKKINSLSFLSLGFSSPNPPVACVIFDEMNQKILSTGFTQVTGTNHAELQAYTCLPALHKQNIHSLALTLEPCSHYGKTPPCLDLILKCRPQRVLYGLRDINPIVKKKRSLPELKKNGISVIQDKKIRNISKIYLNGFFSRLKKGRPSFLLKTALTSEGFFCPREKKQVAISNASSNRLSQLLRAKYDAVIVGPKTTYIDQPSLNFRKLEFISNSDFDFPNENFLSDVMSHSLSDENFIEFHNQNFNQYQPYRVFVISKEKQLSEEFLNKQEKLNQKYNQNKVVFFLSKNDLPLNFIKKLEKISEGKVYFLEKDKIAISILKQMGKLACNNVVVEGGNFLYQEFSKIFSSYDTLLKIKSKKSMKELSGFEFGNKPSWNFTKNLSLDFSFSLDRDLWEFYKCTRV